MGTVLEVGVKPFPSSPALLSPQHAAVMFELSSHADTSPTDTAMASRTRVWLICAALPLLPQHQTPPFGPISIAQAC